GPAACGARTCGVDTCGRSCGSCDGGLTCDLAVGRCTDTCTRETTTAFCARLAAAGKVCGPVTDVDSCSGARRTEACGNCPLGQLCTATNSCRTGCDPETPTAFCARMAQVGKVCGSVTDVDPCTNQPRTETCGTCPSGNTCTASNTCASTCTPESVTTFCTRLGKACGEVAAADNCGVMRRYLCGTCPNGTCQADNTCCSFETPQGFCARMATAGKACGVVSGMSCGTARQEDCGTARCSADGGSGACNFTTNACVSCTTENDAQFCARLASSGLECGTVTGTDSCTQLPRVADCGSAACGTGTACMNNRCTGAGGTCASPVTLMPDPTDPNRYFASSNTGAGQAALTASCGATAGAELVYLVNVGGPSARSVVATVRAQMSSALGPTLAVRTTCAATTGERCETGASMASVRLNQVSPGARYFVVDSASASAQGPFTLDVRLGAPFTAPPNDKCPGTDGGTLIDLGNPTMPPWTSDGPNDRVLAVTGTTSGADNDLSGSCGLTAPGQLTGGDVVYRLVIPTGSPSYQARFTVTSSDGDLLPAVSLRSATCLGTELGCAATNQPGPAQLTRPSLGPGTYFIHVDGVSGTGGSFTLSVQLTGP
ncbi:MAG: hypothetical protein INH41_02400, partial [Myxococcaceae bacterium]|nr:hypothetical protein [Myxococcaceae bacterium]